MALSNVTCWQGLGAFKSIFFTCVALTKAGLVVGPLRLSSHRSLNHSVVGGRGPLSLYFLPASL